MVEGKLVEKSRTGVLVGGTEFRGWCKGTYWNETLLGKEIEHSKFRAAAIF